MKSLNILVVDDLPYQTHAAKILLEGLGHTVTTAGSYSKAKEQFVNGGNFDVVLTDMMMPVEKDGLSPDTNFTGSNRSIPYGFNIALLAAKYGVQKVAIVSNGNASDGNHHNHPVLWATDDLVGCDLFDGKLKVFAGYSSPCLKEDSPAVAELFMEGKASWVKDWAAVLLDITK